MEISGEQILSHLFEKFKTRVHNDGIDKGMKISNVGE